MRIVLDNWLSVGWTVGQWAPPQLAGTFFVKGVFKLRPGAPAITAEKAEPVSGDIPATQAETSSIRYASDFAPHKLRADVLVAGTAYTPEGKPATAVRAGFGLGPAEGKGSILEKRLTVTGPRAWNKGMLSSRPGEPQPFLSLPLIYEHAFGGAGVDANPAGKGREDLMPQIELDGAPVLSPRDKNPPAGFCPIAPTWYPRNHKLGRYDAAWLKERWPWFPKDFNWEHFNAAPRDQQVEGYLRGDEAIYFQNMHPKVAHYASSLPGFRTRCFIQDRLKDGSRFREVQLKLDTLWADMDAEKLVLVWRGQLEVQSIKLKELEYVFAVTEPLSQPPKPMEFWQQELARRVAGPPAPPEKTKEPPAPDNTPSFAQMNQEMAQLTAEMHKHEAAANAHIADSIRQLQAKNIPTTAFPTKGPFGPQTLAEVPAFLKQMEALANTSQVASLGMLAQSGKPGLKLPPEMSQPLKFNLPSELAKAAQIQQQAASAPAPAATPETDNRWTRVRVEAHARAGKPFARQRLDNLDLTGIDLSGADLAFARLSGAKLSGAKLSGANCTGAEFGGADLTKADLSRCNLHGAGFVQANLTGAALGGARLDDTNFYKANLTQAVLGGAKGFAANFSEANLAEVNGAGVNLEGCTFAGANAEKADFRGARLASCGFIQVKAAEADFSGGDLTNFRGQQGNFEEAKFKRCKCENSAWTEANLTRTDFTYADLPRALFDFVVLEGALFGGVDAPSANFSDSNLKALKFTVANGLRCTFDRANLSLADFQGANLYEANFWDSVTDGADFRNANLKKTRLAR